MSVELAMFMIGSSMGLAQVSNSLEKRNRESLSKLAGVISLGMLGVVGILSTGTLIQLLSKL